jgi:pimeloyl-ACP methyl ester carboxylesterase
LKSTLDIAGPVHVERIGRHGSPMVLVHGLGSSHVHWYAVTRRLARDHRLLLPDLPGFGRSPVAGRQVGVEANAKLVAELVDRTAEEAGEPVILAGHSMGALIAMLVAARPEANVAGLILVALPGPRPPWAPIERRLGVLLSAYAWPVVGELTREAWVRLHGPEGVVRSTFEVCCTRPDRVPAGVLSAALRMSAERPPKDEVHAFLASYRSTWMYLLNGRRFDRIARSVEAPTLVIHGSADRLVPPVVARRLPRLRPDWRFVRLEDCGHMPQVDDPEGFLAAVTSWLPTLAARPAS